ncbi:tetratricopeptide repeat protein [Geitlerinema sp. P-1104]|uniref:tetratricopeptide repeat protein n=1 Tax=Geitlerinema sp. P-1104 TaxID=2546230 RepID=UPI00336C02AF
MSKKRSGWFSRIVLAIGLIAFLGFSIGPLLGGVLQSNRGDSTPTATSTPSPTTPDDDLKAQERGYKLVLEREPDNQTALRGLIDVRRQLNDVEGTVAPLERLAELNPEESRFRVLLAQTKQYLGDREGAVETYRDLINQEPGNVQALQGLVTLLLQENRPESAIAAIEDILQLAPQANQAEAGSIDVVSTQLLLGQVYAEQQRYDQALNVFENLSQEHSGDFRPLVGKGLILEETGQLDEAKAALNTALELAPAQQRDRIQILLEEIQAREAAPTEEAESGE